MASPSDNTVPPCGNKDDNDESSLTVNSKRPAVAAASEPSDAKKRARHDDDNDAATDTTTTTTTATHPESVIDHANTLGYKAGDRFQVLWDLHEDESEDVTSSYWWSATLLEYDGRTYPDTNVAIRVLDYDAYPAGGFPERSQEDVIFSPTGATLLHPATESDLPCRRVGDVQDDDELPELTGTPEEIVHHTVNLMMENHAQQFAKMTAAEQAHFAEIVATKKEKMIRLLENHPGPLVTAKDIQAILSQM